MATTLPPTSKPTKPTTGRPASWQGVNYNQARSRLAAGGRNNTPPINVRYGANRPGWWRKDLLRVGPQRSLSITPELLQRIARQRVINYR